MNARIWWDDLPLQYELKIGSQVYECDAEAGCVWEVHRAAIALDYVSGIPRFGLLGGQFQPSETGKFGLRLPQSHSLDDAPLGRSAGQRSGLPAEYHAAVLSGLMGRPQEQLANPSGVLTLLVAAHDEIGSAPVVFFRVARVLHTMLSLRGGIGTKELDALKF